MGASVEADNKLENIFLDDGRGSYYGVKPNVDVVEQSCSKRVNCSETFRTRGSLSIIKLSTSPFETTTAAILRATANRALVVSVRLLNVMAYQTRHETCQKVRARRRNAEEEAF